MRGLPAVPRIARGSVVIREPRPADAAGWHAGLWDPLVRRHSGLTDATLADVQANIEARAAERATGASLLAVIAAPDDDRLLGVVGYWWFAWPELRTELGFWLTPAARGHGAARAGAGAFVDWSVPLLGLERVTAFSDADNQRAHAVLEALGFVREGRLRAYGRREDGSRVDAFAYGLVADRAAAS